MSGRVSSHGVETLSVSTVILRVFLFFVLVGLICRVYKFLSNRANECLRSHVSSDILTSSCKELRNFLEPAAPLL